MISRWPRAGTASSTTDPAAPTPHGTTALTAMPPRWPGARRVRPHAKLGRPVRSLSRAWITFPHTRARQYGPNPKPGQSLRLPEGSIPPGGERLEALGELLRDGTRHAGADHPGVDLRDADDFGRGAREEDFVRRVEVVAVERHLFDPIRGLARQLDHRVARDAAQDAGIGGGRPERPARHPANPPAAPPRP